MFPRMQMMVLLLCFMVHVGFTQIAHAQASSPLQNLDDLVVTANEIKELRPGGHFFKSVVLKPGSKLLFRGTTTIQAENLITEPGSEICYVPGSSQDRNKVITILAISAKGVKGLKIIGSGADGAGFAADKRAADGDNGRNAEGPGWKGKLIGGKFTDGISSFPGYAGSNGANGNPGEKACDIILYLPDVNPGAEIIIETIGGNGGRGQDAGNGGHGGDSAGNHSPSSGGNGGNGGNGGSGGGSGTISVFLVVPDVKETVKHDNLTSTIRPICGRGHGGEGGSPGAGGAHGDKGKQWVAGPIYDRANNASNGKSGQRGSPGAGPERGELDPKWAVMDLLSTDAYMKLLHQTVWAHKQD